MKIALSSGEKDLKSSLDLRFGRCSYFIIYDLETEQFKTVDNKGQSSSGGAGIAAAQQLIDESVEAVITGNVGPNAYELLNSSNIKIYKGDCIPCKDLIKFLKEGKLTEIKEAGPAHHGGGR
ncbi:MAG: diguanylate cyclase [Tissierellia bacterium]|nr:diguanylate cyclase [Tissierellia bacterium]